MWRAIEATQRVTRLYWCCVYTNRHPRSPIDYTNRYCVSERDSRPEDEVICKVRRVAAERDTTSTGLVREDLTWLPQDDEAADLNARNLANLERAFQGFSVRIRARYGVLSFSGVSDNVGEPIASWFPPGVDF